MEPVPQHSTIHDSDSAHVWEGVVKFVDVVSGEISRNSDGGVGGTASKLPSRLTRCFLPMRKDSAAASNLPKYDTPDGRHWVHEVSFLSPPCQPDGLVFFVDPFLVIQSHTHLLSLCV